MKNKPIDKLPQWWCIKNEHQEVRDWLAEKYGTPRVKQWSEYTYIGYDNCSSNGGVHGVGSIRSFDRGNVEISFEDFKKFVLKPKSEITNDYQIY